MMDLRFIFTALPFLSCYPSNSTFCSVVLMISFGDPEFAPRF